MKSAFSLILLAACAAFAAPAMAQPVPCELHVWPSRPGTPSGSADSPTPSIQALAASTIDMVSLFAMNPGMVVFESDKLDLNNALNNPHRLLETTPACHAEMILTNEIVKTGGAATLKTGFIFRDFRKGTLQVSRGSASSAVPAARSGSNPDQPMSEAFVANIKDVARQVAAQVR